MRDFPFSQLADLAVRATTSAAIACYPFIGKGNAMAADNAAVEAMRATLSSSDICGTVVIGEGERDTAPMLHIGEIVGQGYIKIDIALDPLEGTDLCASGMANAVTTIVLAQANTILHAPDVYMDKIATCIPVPENILDLDFTPAQNVINLSRFLNKDPCEIGVVILNRKRHDGIIQSLREICACVRLIQDGDIMHIMQTSANDDMTHMYIGTGGAPEGVIAAAALKTLGGFMQGRLISTDQRQIMRAKSMGISDFNKKLSINDMVRGEAIFCATGVTDGLLLGISHDAKHINAQSMLLNSKLRTKTILNTTFMKDEI